MFRTIPRELRPTGDDRQKDRCAVRDKRRPVRVVRAGVMAGAAVIGLVAAAVVGFVGGRAVWPAGRATPACWVVVDAWHCMHDS